MILAHAGGPFAAVHAALIGVPIDWGGLRAQDVPPALWGLVTETWGHRAQTEFQSIGVMTQFLGDVLAAGDPIEIYSVAADAIRDEIRHTALCVGVVEALGTQVRLPEREADPEDFARLPAAARALTTGIAMLAINETVSVALLRALRERATHPVIAAVLQATLADEDEHGDFGWQYVAASLQRFDEGGLVHGRRVAAEALRRFAHANAPPPVTAPAAELAHWGLLDAADERAIITSTIDDVVRPRLRELRLL